MLTSIRYGPVSTVHVIRAGFTLGQQASAAPAADGAPLTGSGYLWPPASSASVSSRSLRRRGTLPVTRTIRPSRVPRNYEGCIRGSRHSPACSYLLRLASASEQT
jgi:hypothetical protein